MRWLLGTWLTPDLRQRWQSPGLPDTSWQRLFSGQIDRAYAERQEAVLSRPLHEIANGSPTTPTRPRICVRHHRLRDC
jgi:hypothetical protein